MVLKYFKSNQPGVLMLVPIVTAVCWLPFFFSQPAVDPGANWALEFISPYPLDPVISKIICAVLVALQALWMNRIMNSTELFGRPTYIFSLVFIVISAICSYNGELTEAQLSLLFVLPAVDELLDMFGQRTLTNHVFKAGVLLGVATLICPVNLFLFLLPYAGLYLIRSFYWRDWLFTLIGFALPFLFWFTIAYARQLPFIKQYLVSDTLPMLKNITDFYLFQHVVLCILLFFGFLTYLGALNSTIIKIRKMRLLIVYMLVFGTGALIGMYTTQTARVNFQLLIIPFTAILSFYILNARFKWMASLGFYLLLAFYFLRNVLYDFY